MLQEEEKLDNNNPLSSDLLDTQKEQKPEIKLWKRIYLAIMGMGGIYLISLIIVFILLFFTTKDFIESAGNFIVYSVLFVTLGAVSFVDFPKLAKQFKDWKPYVAALVGAIIIVVFEMVYLGIVNLFYDTGIGGNEEEVRSVIEVYPIASLFIFGIIGPICEELTYRVGLFGALRKLNVVLAYILTTIAFGLIHFRFNAANIWIELVNLPCYLFSGFVFSFLYHKFGFLGSALAHVGNNLYAIITQIIIKELGLGA